MDVFKMDEKELVGSLITTIGSLIQEQLLDKDQRLHHKEQCSERIAAESPSREKPVPYSDQAVLANLDWGIDALEEAITTSNAETQTARLDYAHKMLQVCAMLDSSGKTAGLPNSYLSAWAHLNLSYLCKLRGDARSAALHVLEMFVVEPFFARIDFAPEVWKSIFLPHMGSVIGWYSEERRRIVMDVIPEGSDLSVSVDFDQYFNESLILSIRPEQEERIQDLEQAYGRCLDENTKVYAKYYKDCICGGKAIPMLPIAEAPMTPLHEISSRGVPDYVKFGPILPKTAGFSPVIKHINNSRDASRLEVRSTLENLEDSVGWDAVEEECKDSLDYPHESTHMVPVCFERENDDDSMSARSNRSIRDVKTMSRSQKESPHNSSPTDSPRSKISSPRSAKSSAKIQASMLRLLSTRATDPISPESSVTSPDSDGEMTAHPMAVRKSVGHPQSVRQVLPKSSLGSPSYISSPTSEVLTRPPKDFVCPITGQIFNDPVTLETGQTYERKAIQEWMSRGNTTCPITRQPLSAALLPKTNYVLKRLITSWKDQHPELAQEYSCNETPPPVSFEADNKPQRFTRPSGLSTSQASVETVINALKPYILCLCNSEDLQECEASVLEVSKICVDSKVGPRIHSYLSSPTIVNGFVEILSASLNKNVLKTTIHILSQLICADDRVGDLLTSIDSDFYWLADLLTKGLDEAIVVMYLLRPSFSQLSSLELISILLRLISKKSEVEDDICGFEYTIEPKDAAIGLLEQIIVGGDESERAQSAMILLKENGILALLNCLNRVDGRQYIVSILLCCIRIDIECKTSIATTIELSPILELFHGGNDNVRGICIEFLCELVQLDRRRLANQILQIIKEEGTFSTMHTLLVYLQMSPMDQKPAIANLLLQLDLLAAPRKMSIYREEAIEALLEIIQRKDFPSSQAMALGTLCSLSGHAKASQKPYMECLLLKIAGFDQPYDTMMRGEERSNEIEEAQMKQEERAARAWEKRMAFVLTNHEKGIIFKALEECLRSNSLEIAKSSLVVATWLVHMLYSFPDCGVRDVARKLLLEKFVNVLQSSKNLEERILSALALYGFISEPGGLNEIAVHAKSIWKTLRRLKKSCTIAQDIMKALMNLPSMDAAELWSYAEGPELDVSMNGEILSMLHIRNRLISGHSDGTIKVWDTGKRTPRVIQEARQHSKVVTCLYVPPLGDKLYSGSLDKTIRVWSIKQEEIHCVQVHDVKEAVLVLAADANVACFSSQASGVKVYNWSGLVKNISFNKQVKCLALDGDKLYCGCSGYSIQEVDLRTLVSSTYYTGAKKLLGKQTILSLQIQDDLLYACGSSVDGTAGKVFKLSSKAIVGSFPTSLDIQDTTINNEFVFTATKCGMIEVWVRDKVRKIGCIKMASGGSARITSDGQKLFAATSDAKIQVWSLE